MTLVALSIYATAGTGTGPAIAAAYTTTVGGNSVTLAGYNIATGQATKWDYIEVVLALPGAVGGAFKLGRTAANWGKSAAGSGRGLIGLVQPGGTIDDALRAHYVQIARSPQMARAVARYNTIAKFLGQKPSASIDDIAKALRNDVTFSRVGHFRSGLFVPGRHGMVVRLNDRLFVPNTTGPAHTKCLFR